MITNINYNVINEYHLPLTKLFAVNHNNLLFMKNIINEITYR